MITIEGLSKSYFQKGGKQVVALQDINFQVEQDEFLSVVGPTGCGKTTLLNLIAGLERPSSGRVLINGNEVEAPGLDRGMVFQDAPLFPWKTVAGNIQLALKVRGVKKDESSKLTREYLNIVNLSNRAGSYPKDLSGGMRQRAALARTLALDPKILLMDEPFGALDAQTRALMQEELLSIWERFKKTVIFVTHSLDEAVFLSDRVIVLSAHSRNLREIVKIDLPRPRTPALRSKSEFSELRYRICELIRLEVLGNDYSSG